MAGAGLPGFDPRSVSVSHGVPRVYLLPIKSRRRAAGTRNWMALIPAAYVTAPINEDDYYLLTDRHLANSDCTSGLVNEPLSSYLERR